MAYVFIARCSLSAFAGYFTPLGAGMDAGCTNQQIHLIASAQLVSNNPSSASYKLSEVWYGVMATNVVRVLFCQDTVMSGGCPRQAILILEKEDGWPSDWLVAIGWDASLGCLPYSDNKWSEVKHTKLAELSQTRPENRIAKGEAIDIAFKAVSREGRPNKEETLKCEARRYNFGWIVNVTFILENGKVVIGSDVSIRIGDDGRIKEYQHGL